MRKFIVLLVVCAFSIVASAQSDTTLQEYAGKYKFPEGSAVTETVISTTNGGLYAKSDAGESELKKTQEKDVFDVVAYAGTATFRRKDGKIVGILLIVGDMELEGVLVVEKP